MNDFVSLVFIASQNGKALCHIMHVPVTRDVMDCYDEALQKADLDPVAKAIIDGGTPIDWIVVSYAFVELDASTDKIHHWSGQVST